MAGRTEQRLVSFNGVLRIERDVIDIEMLDPREIDPDWRFTDSAGHEHSWNGPQSFEERVIESWWCADCRDTHEGSAFFCIRCDEKITPGTRPARNPTHMRGPTRYYLNDEPISEERAKEIMGVS